MGIRHAAAQLLRFAWAEALSCAFPAAMFAGLALTSVLDLPIPRYDAMLIWGLLLTFGFWALRIETPREVGVIFAFHLVGLALELYKVRMGSWSYPGDAYTKVGDVPLYSGFLYAGVGSYICQAWRRFDLRVERYPAVTISILAAAVYVNFFTHHVLPDVRWWLAAAILVALWRTRVHYTVGAERYAMPLSLAFVLIGFFLWLAENAATYLGAWRYPDQAEIWQAVHPSKFGAWALLVIVSFVLVATLKMTEGRLYGDPSATATVTGEEPPSLP